MTNLEKHREEIEKELTLLPESSCIRLAGLREDGCNNHVSCNKCTHSFVEWLLTDVEEKCYIDWSQVEPGTSCLVKDYEHCVWETAVFVTFTLGKPWFMYKDDLRTLGGVLNNANSSTPLVTYNYCKLEKDEE